MYAKVFKGLFYGSLMGHSETQLVFVCLLAHCDADGYVELPARVISALTGIPEESVQRALQILEDPDPTSRTADDEGRRIERIHDFGAWSIVNYLKYRAMRDKEDRRRQNREAQARYKDRKRSAKVSRGKPHSAQAEAEAEVEVRTLTPARRAREREPDGFPGWYTAYPRPTARRRAAKAYMAAFKRRPTLTQEDLLWATGEFRALVQREAREKQYIPHPATWLNADGFMDFLEDDDASQGTGRPSPSTP